jgi:hypothetical protein
MAMACMVTRWLGPGYQPGQPRSDETVWAEDKGKMKRRDLIQKIEDGGADFIRHGGKPKLGTFEANS